MRLSLEQIAAYLQGGNVAAVPTETVYGLAACLHAPHAIEEIFALKGRPLANPLIIHVADRREIADYVRDFPPHFGALAEAFWPGPMTLILPVNQRVPSIARAGLPTAGFRIPSHSLTQALLKTTGPLVMPSANLSGKPSATRPEHVEEDFGIDLPLLDGGICLKGLESTILLYQEPQWVIARLGAIAAETFQTFLGYCPQLLSKEKNQVPLCPGQLYRHYAPRAHLYLGNPLDLPVASFVIGFKERTYPTDKKILYIGSLSAPQHCAENLYHTLRQLDLEEASSAWVDMDFPCEGLWHTIAERLMRAGEKK